MSGPATACVLRRQRDVFGDARFERLGSISVGHLYNLRNSAPYRAHRVVLTKTRPTKAATIGVRKAPAPEGRPGFVRIDSVHQGDLDGTKGLYHINAVDCVTQWEVLATVQTISEAHLLPVIRQMLEQFPFAILGFHADNGSEYVNHRVAEMLEKLRIEFTRSRPRRSNDKDYASYCTSRKDPATVLPTANGVLVKPPPDRAVADAGHQSRALRVSRHVGHAESRQRQTQGDRQLACDRLDLNHQLWGERPGGVRGGLSLRGPPIVR